MRILFTNPCGALGGAETSLREILTGLRAAEPTWELWLLLGAAGPLAEIARNLGVHVVVKPFPPALARVGDKGGRRIPTMLSLLRAAFGTGKYAWQMAGFLRRIKPHIVHSNGLKMHLLSAWTKPRGTPLIWHVHDYVSRRRLMSRLLWRFRNRCSLAICNSYDVARDLVCLLPGIRTTTIYNAIDLQRFSPTGTHLDLDAASGLPSAKPGTVRVGLVATFARWKGHKVFLEALAKIRSKSALRGYVVGAPIYQTDQSQWSREELVQETERLGLNETVGFTGFIEDTSDAMRSLDIVVHASTEPEPFGMVIIEAMACGKPTVVSNAGGAKELFTNGEDALAHEPGDAESLAQAITRLATDEELRKRLGKAGRLRTEQLFYRERVATELASAYRQLSIRARGFELEVGAPSPPVGAVQSK